MKRPLLIIIAGPNGSGKTAVAIQILQHAWLEDWVYINPDNIAREQFGDWNAPDAVLKATNFAATLWEECLREGRSLIFCLS